jgi:flagellar motility protein MotE (MotC chaperone)
MMQVLGQSAQGVGPAQVVVEENTVKQTELIANLKRELDKALKDLIEKENEIKNINKQVKVTKYKELEEECKMYMNECFRLHRVLKKFLI